MQVRFSKYHALGNDFIVVAGKEAPNKAAVGKLTRLICDRRTGVGADGVLYLSKATGSDLRADVFNSDGGWAEKSGNGLRIVGVHLYRSGKRRKEFSIEMGGRVNQVRLVKAIRNGFLAQAEIGRPDFRASQVPVKTKLTHIVNSPLPIGGEKIPITCLRVGNPHTVLVVDDFNFDWHTLGREIETSALFPERTNVEFVKVISRKKIRVAEWERGAGATGSSGTGAAAAVATGVMLGLTDRKCEVQFEPGSLHVEWNEESDSIILTGPVVSIAEGVYETP